jgi:GNAT superfamily N-acetyltransferase
MRGEGGDGMNGERIDIAAAALTDDASRMLIAALNAELSAMYDEPGATHFGLDPEQVSGRRGAFVIVRRGGVAVGCGAVRMIDAHTGELKRMYIAPQARGTGLGRPLVAALENEALARGARRLVLETGVRQAAAIALYRACGFAPIPLYGEYCLSPKTSVCMGKTLDGTTGAALTDMPAGYSISTDKARLDPRAIHAYLTRSYWSPGIPIEIVERAIEHSMCFGVFHGEAQVGFCRVVSDQATFAYLCDVYILEEHRGRGLSKRLIEFVQARPELQGLRKFMLGTRDAHGLYAQYGFKPVANPQNIMEIRDPDVYTPR